MSQLAQLTQFVDTFAVKHLNNMNLPEFTTCVIYYFDHPEICSKDLRDAILEKILSASSEFNEYQLAVFHKLLIKQRLVLQQRGDNTDKVVLALETIGKELE